MKRRFVALAFALTLSSGCAAFWQFIRSNPFGAILEGIGYLQNALGLADTAFNAWASGNPNAEAARQQYNTITGNVRRGISLAQAGTRVAAEARRDNINPDALMHEAQTGMQSLTAFLEGLPRPPGAAQDPLMQLAIRQCGDASRRPVLSP